MTAKLAWAPPSTLPPLYAAWIDDLLGGPIPQETEATCQDCAMCAPKGERPPGALFFNTDTKCCTYVPTLPNFLVGRILADDDPAFARGRATVEARIDARVGVTPLGLRGPPVHALLYQHAAPLAFGRSRRLRCPHYLDEGGGRCGIWRHRNGTCATYLCKYVRGATGQHFWQMLDQLIATVERDLARWCVLHLDVSEEAFQRLFPYGNDRDRSEPLDGYDIDGDVDLAVYQALWGDWCGRERELFCESARLVNRLTWGEVKTIASPDVQLYERLTLDAYRKLLSDAIPARLVTGPFATISMGRDRARVVAYSALDPLALPHALIDLLPYFDGGPTSEILERIEREKGLRLEEGLIRKLVDFQVLRPAPKTPQP